MLESRLTASTKTQPHGRTAQMDTREIIETVVFVLILVNLLRMFGAEAFVIPTGSMATTLLGAHKVKECPQCGYSSYFNASDQAEMGRVVHSGICQNCRASLDLRDQSLRTGDRLVVGKFVYEGFTEPSRWDVVVFKCLESMRANFVPKEFPLDNRTHGVMNYIKRLVGRPGETIRIENGDIFIRERGAKEFQIARKPPHVAMAVRRLVHHNDYQASDLMQYPHPWYSEDQVWTSSDPRTFHCETESTAWLRYRHLAGLRTYGPHTQPELITDFEAYNDGIDTRSRRWESDMNWVGDLMLECTLGVERLSGQITLELVEGLRQYQCVFDLANKTVALLQNGNVIAEGICPINSTGNWEVRFANFDDQLTVWVEEGLIFGDGVVVAPPGPDEMGPRVEDIQPVNIAARNTSLSVTNLAVYRDIYYTQGANRTDVSPATLQGDPDSLESWRRRLQLQQPVEFTAGDDEYFMLGDNSPRSSDSRAWEGTNYVHRRLLLGRALILYWPVGRWKFVR